ncbi:uncharacterized protein LOC141712512 [Apium graveolens]|uniref:uncharacterized protein LOC141712512 n=1 Tax=Apium graveolens TaxID=4045 RepID=UPI003D7956BC
MESESLDFLNDKKTVNLTNEMVVNFQPESDANHEDNTELEVIDFRGGGNVVDASFVDVNAPSEASTKAAIFLDDAIRAGGFGARDDIGSSLPVASDFTDFEASLRDAHDYEVVKEETRRPGLGWAEVKKQK